MDRERWENDMRAALNIGDKRARKAAIDALAADPRSGRSVAAPDNRVNGAALLPGDWADWLRSS